jgi:hypothetical protein
MTDFNDYIMGRTFCSFNITGDLLPSSNWFRQRQKRPIKISQQQLQDLNLSNLLRNHGLSRFFFS